MSLPELDVPDLLRRYGLRPDKRLGQNFLVDSSALRRIIDAAEVKAEDVVLEVGPGVGSLTRLLAENAHSVVTVELDARLLPPLGEALKPYQNVKIVQGDILALHPKELVAGLTQDAPPGSQYLVVANIPYYITSALIRHLLEAEVKPDRMVLTIQREVAERICSAPGDLSLLALSVQVYGQPTVVTHIPAGAFFPAPNVDSAVVRVDLYNQPLIETPLLPLFFRLAKAGFSQKRKTLRNSLAGGMHWSSQQTQEILEAAGIEPRRRAETVSLDEWKALVEYVQQRNDLDQSA